jgi:DNA-binding beta-propeller fold protein YncE
MRIWRLDVQTGIASVFAGRGLSVAGSSPNHALGVVFGAARSLAFDKSGNLYVADAHVGIRRIDAITRRVARLVPTADRSLLPGGLLFVEPGTLYIADSSGYVWCVDPESRLHKVAGGGYGF